MSRGVTDRRPREIVFRDERVFPAPRSTTSAPNCWRQVQSLSCQTIPRTRQPLARSSCTVTRPTRPRPVTTTASPSVGAGIIYALQGDRADDGESCFVPTTSPSGNPGAQPFTRHADDFGVLAVEADVVAHRDLR